MMGKFYLAYVLLGDIERIPVGKYELQLSRFRLFGSERSSASHVWCSDT